MDNENENKHLRIIANPYLLKLNVEKIVENINPLNRDLYSCLSKKYNKILSISYCDIDNILILIDNYITDKIIQSIIDDIIMEI